MEMLNQGCRGGRGDRGHGPSNFSNIVGFSEILMHCRKVFGLLLLVKTKVSNFIGKSLNLVPLLYKCHDSPVLNPGHLLSYWLARPLPGPIGCPHHSSLAFLACTNEKEDRTSQKYLFVHCSILVRLVI